MLFAPFGLALSPFLLSFFAEHSSYSFPYDFRLIPDIIQHLIPLLHLQVCLFFVIIDANFEQCKKKVRLDEKRHFVMADNYVTASGYRRRN